MIVIGFVPDPNNRGFVEYKNSFWQLGKKAGEKSNFKFHRLGNSAGASGTYPSPTPTKQRTQEVESVVFVASL